MAQHSESSYEWAVPITSVLLGRAPGPERGEIYSHHHQACVRKETEAGSAEAVSKPAGKLFAINRRQFLFTWHIFTNQKETKVMEIVSEYNLRWWKEFSLRQLEKWIQNGNAPQIEKKIVPRNYLLNTNALCIGYNINSASGKILDHKKRVIIQ